METTFYAAIAKKKKKKDYGVNLNECGTWKEKKGAKNTKRTHIILLWTKFSYTIDCSLRIQTHSISFY